MPQELATGSDYLKQSAMSFLSAAYAKPKLEEAKAIHKDLGWTPTFHFSVNSHYIIACEASETPFPMVLQLRRRDIADTLVPICVYCVCPEYAYLSQQDQAKELVANGYGLITVDDNGKATLRMKASPLVQQISQAEFDMESSQLSAPLRRRVAESYDQYKSNPTSGVKDITEVIEGMVWQGGTEAVKKGWIQASQVRAGYSSNIIKALLDAQQLSNAHTVLGGIGSYIQQYRNTAAHFPKDKRQAHTKYRDCRHAFLEGLKQMHRLRTAVRSVGLSGGIPNR